MKHIDYRTSNTCSQKLEFDLTDDNKIKNVKFYGGCNGNLKAIGKLVDGMDANDVYKLLVGNTCGYKSTSCADQLAQAIKKNL